jgi:hypothetical protein
MSVGSFALRPTLRESCNSNDKLDGITEASD